ncbi:MAG: hypothetical protein KF696_10080 [Planctomycetes bacterium]|nr:hypothetical protein [Planctomycetota bacterium]MCW8136205.1 hypothetical protein [Planctomycetota bacterium]
MKLVVAFGCGILFALGLGISGMTQPAKVIGFLDFFGNWDPALAFVMASAIGVYLPVWRVLRRRTPALGGKMAGAPPSPLDTRLFAGAALFGIGWGMAGVCPGPAVTILGRPTIFAFVFLAAMLAGMALSWLVKPRTIKS